MIYIVTAMYAEAHALINRFQLKKDISHTRFQVFLNREADICLFISGTGLVPAAAAVSSICTEYGAGQGDFLLNMRKFCQEILDIRQQAKDQQVNGLYQEILAYLEEYYDDSSISLGEMAERFGMSASYLSRFFRKYSGKNFLEYVTEKRIDRACWLLKNTDLKVKTIVEQVGYLDVASFTKKFRTICGVSPAKYREQVRQESKEENL